MTCFKTLFFMSLIVSNVAHAVIEAGEKDVLPQVTQKLAQIESQLKNQRLFVTTATFYWPELHDFRKEIMFVVAHDPTGTVIQDTPEELSPSQLSHRLMASFTKLETSAYQVGSLVKTENWLQFKTVIEQFLNYRSESLFAKARGMIRTGQLTELLDKLESTATIILKDQVAGQNVSVKVIDPVIEKLSQELNQLNVSVKRLTQLSEPLPVPVETIFQEKNYLEVAALSVGALLIGIMGTFSLQWISHKNAKDETVTETTVNIDSFDYYEWLKGLEANLKAFKMNEEKLTEEHIKLKHLSYDLLKSRTGLNLADNQQDFYISLELLNATAPKLEEYFDKINVKQNAELSRRMVKMVIQLCDAIESRHEISFTESRTKLKTLKADPRLAELNAA